MNVRALKGMKRIGRTRPEVAAIAPFAVIVAVAAFVSTAPAAATRTPGLQQDSEATVPAVGTDPAFDARAARLADQLRCPVCLGNSVQDSPSELAHDMRQLIREQLAAGKTDAEIKQFFVERYGEWVLLNPEPRGFNLVVWLLPLVVVAGGGVGLWIAVAKWTARARSAPPAPSHSPQSAVGGRGGAADDEYLRRVREEVARDDA